MTAADVFIDVQLLDRPVDAVAIDPFPAGAGAECVFLGRTRIEHHPDHGALTMLAYEAYQPMAERVLSDLAAKAVQQFGCLAVRVHHAVGEVPPGAASVLVQVVAAHRDEAFAAARFLIDTLKREAPIWKRERWADGSTWSRGEVVTTKERSR